MSDGLLAGASLAAPPPNPPKPLPKFPVLDWADWHRAPGQALPSVGDLPHQAITTSGRAALLAALRQLELPAGSAVLVPSYHCPTMVAPIVQAGLVPVYYPIEPGGLPALDRIDETVADVRAMFVAHYFGLPLSLGRVLSWCRAREIALIEDCAHTYFGMAGDRPVGQWGDYATASLSKFYPVPEGGLLGSMTRPLRPLNLRPQGPRAEAKAAWDVVDKAQRHQCLAGVRHVLSPLFYIRRRMGAGLDLPVSVLEVPPDNDAVRKSCDMSRIDMSATWTARLLFQALPTSYIVARRRDNYKQISEGLKNAPRACGLHPDLPVAAAPYVFPLWVDEPDRADFVYGRLRKARMPVLRWDRHWPGTPSFSDDVGALWSRQVLQLLCHQALSPTDIDRFVNEVVSALEIDRAIKSS